MALLIGALVVVAIGVVVVTTGVADRARELVAPEDEVASDELPPAERQTSAVLVTYDAADPSGQASGLVVLAYDRADDQGTVLLVPTATVADVPGHGSFQLREAFALGDAPLVEVSLANLLGVRFDGAASLSREGWAALLDRAGGYEVDVRTRLVAPADDEEDDDAGGGEVRFEAGEQHLDGDRLAEYLTFRGSGETELETLPRVRQVVVGLLDRIEDDPDVLDDVFADDVPMLEDADPELLRSVLRDLADARGRDRVTTFSLPVSPLGSGREDSYRIDEPRTAALVDEQLEGARPADAAGAGRGVQILNGNGVPGVGQQVAEALGDGGYRVVLTGNADRFSYETTRIIVHDDSDEQLAVAQDVQERLGVGEIERSATPQSVVDVTIVVGADFP